MNMVLLIRTAERLLNFQIRHTTVIPGFAANCGDTLICRYIRKTHQTHGTDISIDRSIGESSGRRSRHQVSRLRRQAIWLIP